MADVLGSACVQETLDHDTLLYYMQSLHCSLADSMLVGLCNLESGPPT